MPNEPAYLSALKKYAKGRSLADLFALETESSYGASDRAMAVLMGATLEGTLGDCIVAHLREDLTSGDQRQLLATFASKTTLAYALGIIGPDTRHDLDLVRNVRNQFAHSRRPLQFTIKEVADVCAHLNFPDLPGVSIPVSYIKSAPNPTEAADLKHPRTRYFTTCHTIAYRIVRVTTGTSPLDTTVLPEVPLP